MEEQKNDQAKVITEIPKDSASVTPISNNNETPEEDSRKKKKFFFWFIIILGAFALVQSILVFGKDGNKEDVILDEPNSAVVEDVIENNPEEIIEEETGQFASNNVLPPAPPKIVDPIIDTPEEEELLEEPIEELTIDDCIEADIVMAAINPEDIDDNMVEQCLILWEDLQALLEDEEAATTTPTSTPRRGGGGGGSVAPVLSANVSLFGFTIGDYDVLGLPNLEIDEFFATSTTQGASLEVNDWSKVIGSVVTPDDPNVTELLLRIYQGYWHTFDLLNPESVERLNSFQFAAGDIAVLKVVAEDGATTTFYRVNLFESIDDATLSLFNVDFIDVLPFKGLQVNAFTEQGANLILPDYQCVHPEFSNVPCIGEDENLTGIFVQPQDNDFSYIKVEIIRPSALLVFPAPTLIWENKDIANLKTEDILLGDIIQVTVVAEDGETTNLYKLNIIDESFIDASLSKFNIDSHNILSLENLEVKDKTEEGAMLYVDGIENCPDWSNYDCSQAILKGLTVDTTENNVSYVGVSLLRDGVWKLWENDEIDLLAQEKFLVDDVILVRVVSQNGWQEAMYKVSIKIAPAELSEDVLVKANDKEIVKIKPILSGGNSVAPVKIEKEPKIIEPVKIIPVELNEVEVIEFQDGEDVLSESLVKVENAEPVMNTKNLQPLEIR
jgi:hypothetical protein